MPQPDSSRVTKAMEPILCCGSSKPILSPGAYKIHNDPNRELHEDLFHSFQEFVIRTQHQATKLTMMQLVLSHIQDVEEFPAPGPSNSLGGDILTKAADRHASCDSQAEVISLQHQSDDTGFSTTGFLASLLPGTNELGDTNDSPTYFHGFATAPLSEHTNIPMSPPQLASCHPAPPPNATPLFKSGLYLNRLDDPVPSSSTDNDLLFSSPLGSSKRSSGPRLSSAAPAFVPGMFRGSLPSGFMETLNQVTASVTPPSSTNKSQNTWLGGQISTQNAAVRSSGVPQAGPQASVKLPHTLISSLDCTQNISELKFKEQNLPDSESYHHGKILGDLSLDRSDDPFVSSYALSRHYTEPRASSQYHRDLVAHMGVLREPALSANDIPAVEPLNDFRSFQEEAQDLQYTPQSPPVSTKTCFSQRSYIHNAGKGVSATNSLLGSYPYESPSVVSPMILDHSSGQLAHFSVPALPASQSRATVSAETITPSRRSTHPARPYMESAVSSSSMTFLPPPRTSPGGPSWRHQSQDADMPATSTPMLNLKELENNPLTERSPFVIHVASRLDYGPVLSHRYFLVPEVLDDDWVEISLSQWWARGAPFKVKAEKWDVKCSTHGKFFRMTLLPNLLMRGEPAPTFRGLGRRYAA